MAKLAYRLVSISIHALREEGDKAPSGRNGFTSSISIHALREEGDRLYNDRVLRVYISIHALREEGDTMTSINLLHHLISIHALREEGDFSPINRFQFFHNFYPRPPRGGRRATSPFLPSAKTFLSTPSARRATHEPGHPDQRHDNFYPRPPRGGRPACASV